MEINLQRLTVALASALALASCGGETTETPEDAAGSPEASASVPDTEPVAAPADDQSANVRTAVGCGSKEKVIFSCNTANDKRIAVCSAPGGPVRYRYGAAGSEIELEATGWASVPYSGGGEAQIAFANGNTRYIVFSRVVRTNFEPGEPNDPAISDGVVVLRGDDFLALQQCDDAKVSSVDVNALEALLDRSDDLFTGETTRAERN